MTIRLDKTLFSEEERKNQLDALTDGGRKAADITATQFSKLVQGGINKKDRITWRKKLLNTLFRLPELVTVIRPQT